MGKKITREQFIKRAREIHGDEYDYSKVIYKGYNEKVCIICSIHGEFWQTPHNHISGSKCPKCIGKCRYTTSEWVKEAIKKHGDKYDYSKVIYKGAFEKVCIICPKHGEFWQTPNNHLNGDGCKECDLERKRKTLKDFVKRAKQIHSDKYDYSKVEYKNSRTKVCIICPKHGEFWQTPNSHLNGRGCPTCKESSLEKEVEIFLSENKITYKREFKEKWLGRQYLDFYLPQYKIGIECQGEQHFKPKSFGSHESLVIKFEKSKKCDIEKISKCNENKVKLFHYFKDKRYFGTYENEIHNLEDLKKVLIT